MLITAPRAAATLRELLIAHEDTLPPTNSWQLHLTKDRGWEASGQLDDGIPFPSDELMTLAVRKYGRFVTTQRAAHAAFQWCSVRFRIWHLYTTNERADGGIARPVATMHIPHPLELRRMYGPDDRHLANELAVLLPDVPGMDENGLYPEGRNWIEQLNSTYWTPVERWGADEEPWPTWPEEALAHHDGPHVYGLAVHTAGLTTVHGYLSRTARDADTTAVHKHWVRTPSEGER